MDTESKRIGNMQLGVTYSKDIFGILDGQRPVEESNVLNLMDSIVENDGIIEPITVDSNMNVINGGHRVEAVDRLNKQGYSFPINYVINHNCEPKAMKHSNIKNLKWKLANFLNFEAEQGDLVCKRVIQLQKEYSDFAPGVVANIMNNVLGRTAIKSLSDSNYQIDENTGRKVLDACRAIGRSGHLIAEENRPYALARFTNAMKKIILLNEHFDVDYLLKKAEEMPLHIYSTTEDIIRKIQQVYNRNERKIDNKLSI